MEHALLGSVDKLFQLGLAGVVIMGLCFAVWRLWLSNRELTSKVNDLQEKRVVEGRESLTAVNANTSALANLTQVLSLRRD